MNSKSKNKLPEIIKQVGFDFHWDEKKVWVLDVPVEEMDIEELEWHFEIPFWFTPGGFYDLTPNQVLEDPEKYNEEFERIMKADLSFPLDIMLKGDRWVLLDGLHRLAKAKQKGMEKVKVRKISSQFIPLIER